MLSPTGLHLGVPVLPYQSPWLVCPSQSSAIDCGCYGGRTTPQCTVLVWGCATGHGMGHGICPIGTRQWKLHSLLYLFEVLGFGHRNVLRNANEMKRKLNKINWSFEDKLYHSVLLCLKVAFYNVARNTLVTSRNVRLFLKLFDFSSNNWTEINWRFKKNLYHFSSHVCKLCLSRRTLHIRNVAFPMCYSALVSFCSQAWHCTI